MIIAQENFNLTVRWPCSLITGTIFTLFIPISRLVNHCSSVFRLFWWLLEEDYAHLDEKVNFSKRLHCRYICFKEASRNSFNWCLLANVPRASLLKRAPLIPKVKAIWLYWIKTLSFCSCLHFLLIPVLCHLFLTHASALQLDILLVAFAFG